MNQGPDFLALQKLLQYRAGMALSSDKLYLVARIADTRARLTGCR